MIHYDSEGKLGLKQFVYQYNFSNNVFTTKEKIITLLGKYNEKTEYLLYKDRYLISTTGNVIDLIDKKILHESKSKFISCSNDSIMFFTADLFKGKFYTCYNISTGKASDITLANYSAVIGQNIEFDTKTSPYKLYYTPSGKGKELIMNDAGHGGVSASEKQAEVPVYWVDNQTFLFPFIKTIDLDGSIVKYNLASKTSKNIGDFNSTSTVTPNYKISKGSSTFVEFFFKDKLYLINPIKETMLQTTYKEMVNNYSVEVEQKSTGRTIYYKGKEVGKNYFQIQNFKSSKNYAALLKEVSVGNEISQQGIFVYNITTNKWETVKAEQVAYLVGWIKK